MIDEEKPSEQTTDENEQTNAQQTAQTEAPKDAQTPPAATEKSDDVGKKIIFALCYLWGILFFLPLVLYKDDKAGRMHANQGLVLLIVAVAANVIGGILCLIPIVGAIVIALINVALLVYAILGIVNVVTDKTTPLPIIGSIHILDK